MQRPPGPPNRAVDVGLAEDLVRVEEVEDDEELVGLVLAALGVESSFVLVDGLGSVSVVVSVAPEETDVASESLLLELNVTPTPVPTPIPIASTIETTHSTMKKFFLFNPHMTCRFVDGGEPCSAVSVPSPLPHPHGFKLHAAALWGYGVCWS